MEFQRTCSTSQGDSPDIEMASEILAPADFLQLLSTTDYTLGAILERMTQLGIDFSPFASKVYYPILNGASQATICVLLEQHLRRFLEIFYYEKNIIFFDTDLNYMRELANFRRSCQKNPDLKKELGDLLQWLRAQIALTEYMREI